MRSTLKKGRYVRSLPFHARNASCLQQLVRCRVSCLIHQEPSTHHLGAFQVVLRS